MPMLSAAGSRPLPALALALILPLSAGCSTTSALAPQVIAPEVPASLLTCPPEPVPPAIDGDDQALAFWIVSLRVAGQECRAKLAGIRVWAAELAAPR